MNCRAYWNCALRPYSGCNKTHDRGLVQKVEEIMLRLRSEGHAILLVEQNLALAMAVADRIYVLSSGSFVFHGTPSELSSNPEILDAHLGVLLAAPH